MQAFFRLNFRRRLAPPSVRKVLLGCCWLLLLPGAWAQSGFRLGFRSETHWNLMLNPDFYRAGDTLRLYGPEPNVFRRDSLRREESPGFKLGLSFGYQFNARHGVEVGFLYSWQTVNWRLQQTGGSELRRQDRFHYVKVPLLYRFNTAIAHSQWQFLLHTGLQIGVLADAAIYENDRRLPDPDKALGGLSFQNYFREANLEGVLQLGTLWRPLNAWEFTAQIRLDAALLDIEDASYKLPGRGPTHPLTVGTQLGFNYIFGQADPHKAYQPASRSKAAPAEADPASDTPHR